MERGFDFHPRNNILYYDKYLVYLPMDTNENKQEPPWIKHYEWEDEEGRPCSSWKINTGNHIVNTGDAGMKMFKEALQKELEKWKSTLKP